MAGMDEPRGATAAAEAGAAGAKHAGHGSAPIALALRAPVIPREAVPFYWRTPWYHGWTIIAVSLVCQTLTIGTVFISFTFFAQQWAQDFGAEQSRVQLAFTAASFSVCGLGLFIGRFFDTMSVRVLMAVGMGLFALTGALLSLATGVWQVIALYGALLPFAMALCAAIPAQVLAARWFPHKRGFAIGVVNLGVPLAGLVMPPVLNMLIGDLGWRASLQIVALVAALWIVPVLALVRTDPPVATAGEVAPPPAAPRTAMEILTSRGFWLLMFVLSALLLGVTGFNTNLAGYGQERGLSLGQVAAVLAMLSIVGIPAAFLWGYFADKVEHRWLLLIAAIVGALGALALALTHGFAQVMVVSCIVGLVFGGVFPLMGASLAAQFGAESLGRATGFAAISIALSSFGAPLFAKLHESYGNYTPAMLMVAAAALVAALGAMFLKYDHG